jgi:type II secretory pathway component PulK
MSNKSNHSRFNLSGDQGGAALIMALAILGLIVFLGTASIRSMMLSWDEAKIDSRAIHARALAERGLNAAIGEVGASLDEGGAVLQARTYNNSNMPIYRPARADDGTNVPQLDEGVRSNVEVTVTDESAKINLNHAPVRVLQALLGIDGATARRIRAGLPRPGEGSTASQRWYAHVDDLAARSVIDAQTFKGMPSRFLTVHSVPGSGDPTGTINVNTAEPEVLAAIFNVDVDRARQLIRQRPFNTMADVQSAVGKEPASYNLAPPPGDPQAMPEALALDSRVYRLRCNARVIENGTNALLSTELIEAVVQYDDSGRGHILSWRVISGAEQTAG